jgi:hypothetical protein
MLVSLGINSPPLIRVPSFKLDITFGEYTGKILEEGRR